MHHSCTMWQQKGNIMISGLTSYPVVATFPDPAADLTVIVARVPAGNGAMTLKGGSCALSLAIASHADNHIAMTLKKVGIDGLATPVAVSAALGGASSAWAANVPRPFVLDAAEVVLLAGEYLTATYNEEGTVAPGMVTLCMDFAPGVSA